MRWFYIFKVLLFNASLLNAKVEGKSQTVCSIGCVTTSKEWNPSQSYLVVARQHLLTAVDLVQVAVDVMVTVVAVITVAVLTNKVLRSLTFRLSRGCT